MRLDKVEVKSRGIKFTVAPGTMVIVNCGRDGRRVGAVEWIGEDGDIHMYTGGVFYSNDGVMNIGGWYIERLADPVDSTKYPIY